MKPGRVILLNGVGSSGKSSIARALQEISADPLLHMQMDAILDMLPPSYMNHPDGLVFEAVSADPPSVAIHTGPVVDRLLAAMAVAVVAMAKAGQDIIVDDVIYGDRVDRWHAALSGITATWVGVVAPLDVIEQREASRGDRMRGLARWQYERVHVDASYDLTVNTSATTPHQSAAMIAAAAGLATR